MNLLVLHGPNLNRLGQREPEIYGTWTLEEVDASLKHLGVELEVNVDAHQSNHEGDLIDRIQAGLVDQGNQHIAHRRVFRLAVREGHVALAAHIGVKLIDLLDRTERQGGGHRVDRLLAFRPIQAAAHRFGCRVP